MDKLIHPRILELRKDKGTSKKNGSFKHMLKELYKKKHRKNLSSLVFKIENKKNLLK